jgi:hypothetical protein
VQSCRRRKRKSRRPDGYHTWLQRLLQVGDAVAIGVNLDDAVVFSAKTGEQLRA